MKKLIQRLITSGADLSTKKALKTALGVLGADPVNIDKIYVEVKNSLHKEEFLRINPKKKILFLPQCLRHPTKCKAKMTKHGFLCQHCGACKISDIKKEAEKRGYRVHIVLGGSMVIKAIKDFKPEAVMGVACIKELVLAMEEIKIPTQGVELSRDGCINTDVDLKSVIDSLDGNESDKKE